MQTYSRIGASAASVPSVARDAHLHREEAEAAVENGVGVIEATLDVAPGSVRVAVGRFANLAAQQLIDGHVRLPAFDVPEGHMNTADGVVEHWPIAPVRA